MFRDFSNADKYERRIERLGFEVTYTHGVGRDKYSIQFPWPDYAELVERREGNVFILNSQGLLKDYVMRLPGFGKERFDAEVPESIIVDAAASIGLDPAKHIRINTWGNFHAYHFDYRIKDHPERTVEDMLDATKVAKDRLDEDYTPQTFR